MVTGMKTSSRMLQAVTLLTWLLSADCSVLTSLYFLHSPADLTVSRGEEAVLQCEAGPSHLVTDCQWSKEGVGLGGLEHLARHSMRGCSLVISPVQLSDEGEYRCQVAAQGSSAQPLLSSPARLQVQVEPGRPSVLEARQGDWLEVEQGEELLLTCESQGGRPHAELQWRDDQGRPVLGNAVETVSRIEGTNSFKTVSKMRFNPLEPMSVTCTAHSEAFPEVRASRQLAVQLRKKVEEELVTVKPGENVRLTCGQMTGTYKWFLNDREVEGETANTLDIEDFTPHYDNSVVKCLQEKFGGESRLLKLVRLRAEDETSRRRRPRTNTDSAEALQEDQTVAPTTTKKRVFTCVTEEPQEDGTPQYVWVNGRLERRLSSASDTEGRKYKCTVLPGGVKKVKQMENKLKNFAKDLRKFSKILKGFTTPVEIP